MTKRIAIVGGGMSGLVTIVALKEVGLRPVCFEATDQLGGAWHYREEALPGVPSIMPTTISTNSKEIGAVSNLAPPTHFSTYMNHREMLQYLQMYAKEKDCLKYVQFNSEVTLVKRVEDYGLTGGFSVTVRNTVTGQETTEVFDGVVVASGHLSYPKTVTFEGQERFQGTIVHTHSLKRADPYKGKNVLIVGCGCSGLEAADVISSIAKNVYLSCRSGFINLCRQGPSGYPLDYSLQRRYLYWMLGFLPFSVRNWYIETFYADARFDHNLYRVPPKYGVLSKDPILNDAIGSKLLSGTVEQKPVVKYLTEDGANFEGEDTVTAVDDIVLATGYDFKFPFLEEGLLTIENGRIDLYKCMYPEQLPYGTLAFVGFVNTFGPDLAVSEMQSRHIAHIISGRGRLPSPLKMAAEIEKRHEKNARHYAPSSMLTNRVDFLRYMDDLASEIGCKPYLFKYLFTDLALFSRLVFGPILPYQYRLEGSCKWGGARDAVLKSRERLLFPLVESKIPKKGFLQTVIEYLGNLIPSPRNISNF